ncbi:MAG: site-specific integrase [Spirochaetales bacterium]|nr:site-specific integrase [Spirochaetales bacterium]
MITKAVKNSGKIGSVKEKKDKFVRLPERAMYYLEFWKEESLAPGDDDSIFYGKETCSPIDRGTISTNFRKALDKVGIDRENRVIVPHSLRHTFNTYSLINHFS